MNLEDYFDFKTFAFGKVGKIERIRIKGSRIGIEHIVGPYLKGDSPERIFHGYRQSLSLEQVYATITYYLHNKERVEAYLKHGEEVGDYFYQEHLKKEPPAGIKRARALKEKKLATQRKGS